METTSIYSFIEDSPTAVSILDEQLHIICHSKVWLQEFDIASQDIIGKPYRAVLPTIPPLLDSIFRECLKGETNVNKGYKYVWPNGKVQWFKWKVKPWKRGNGRIGGLSVIMNDITAEKREEELLGKAEAVAKIGGWEIDLITNRIYWTAITKEIHEVPQDYMPDLEKGINFYKEGEHRDKITELVSEAISEGTGWDTELVIVTAKGKEIWVRAKGETEMFNGKCVRVFGTFQDIDEKKKAEMEYQEVAERLKIATKVANIGIWDYDILNNSLVWDDNMYRLYNISKEDFSQCYEAWEAVVHPEDKKRGQQEVQMAINGEKDFDTEFRVIWSNGEIRHIRGMAKIERNSKGEAVKMIGANWDITPLKNTQLKLARNKESFTGAFENSTIGMALVGLDGKWMQVNESVCKSLGYEKQELMNLTFQEITYPDDLESDLTLLHELVHGKRTSYQIEKRYFHKKGHLIYALLTVTAVKKINGELSHFISQILDITSRKEAEEKLNQLVKVTSNQNESLLNFAHIVSHNLRSHATNLSMLTGFLGKEKDEDEKLNLLRMLNDASESLNETVMHLNEVVQVKAGAVDQLKKVNLHKTIMGVKKNLSLLLQEKHTTCHIDIPKKLNINAIPAYLDSVFLNLFTNSIKYSSPDRNPEITISAVEVLNRVRITFTDNGLGIDLSRHGKKLFGMYKTFHRNKDAKGIGLFITKNQIEAMNGKIEVESTVGVGTSFTLYLDKNQYTNEKS